LGPFLEENHEQILSGKYSLGEKKCTLKDIYNELWKLTVNKLRSTRIVVVPSI